MSATGSVEAKPAIAGVAEGARGSVWTIMIQLARPPYPTETIVVTALDRAHAVSQAYTSTPGWVIVSAVKTENPPVASMPPAGVPTAKPKTLRVRKPRPAPIAHPTLALTTVVNP